MGQGQDFFGGQLSLSVSQLSLCDCQGTWMEPEEEGAAVTTGDWRSKAVKAGMVTTGEKAMWPFM